MIRSMTAFARQTTEQQWGSLVWEIRSVNHRYLEPSFKLPEAVRQIENSLREALRTKLGRGKVECSLRMQLTTTNKTTPLNVNNELLLQLINAGEIIQRQLKDSSGINPLQLLQWPGVLSEAETNQNDFNEPVIAAFQSALQQLIRHREREGSALKAFIEQRLGTIEEIIAAIRQQLPVILKAQKQKLKNRLDELKTDYDSDRLEQEIVILTQKADVDEELDRLDAHLVEVRRVLNNGGTCGRRLDFLMQELNREANTLSSKSIVSDTTQAAVELKVLIEQMREQIQNIE